MFHLMLVLPILIFGIFFLAALVGILLFAVLAIAASVIGGTSVALLVKNKAIKKLLLIGFAILFLLGAICTLPVLMAFADFSSKIAFILAVVFAVLIGFFSSLGIKASGKLNSNIARKILTTIFGTILALVIAILSMVFFYVIFIAR